MGQAASTPTNTQARVPAMWAQVLTWGKQFQKCHNLCPKAAYLGVKPSAPSCPLTLPLYLGLPTESQRHPFRRGFLSLSRNSNHTNCGPDFLEDPEKFTEAFIGLTLWHYLERCNVCLGPDRLTPNLRTRVLGETTTFGDEWLERETRENKDHEIALLPTGSQAVPITELLCLMYSWRTQASTS